MTTPKGMRWIDVTYMAERIDYEQGDGGVTCEAGMRLLVAEDIALELLVGRGGPTSALSYMYDLEYVLRGREMLCHGRYVEGSALVTPVVNGKEA